MTKSLIPISILSLFLANMTVAQNEIKLTSFDAGYGDLFGHSVAINGSNAIIGAPGNDAWPYSDRGTVYIFRLDSATRAWQYIQYIDGDDTHDRFGFSTTMDGDFAMIGAPNDVVIDSGQAGSVYVLRKNGTGNYLIYSWLIPDDVGIEKTFGWSISISGNYAIIGAPGDNNQGWKSGSAYIFKWDGYGWNQSAKIVPSDGTELSFFGISVSVSGDYAIVGTERSSILYDSGAVYIFKRDGENWTELQKIVAVDGDSDHLFGASVSIDGEYAVIGAEKDDVNGEKSGSAYIYKLEEGIWNFKQKLIASNGGAFDRFGCPVYIKGDYSIIGADGGEGNTDSTGSAYVYRREGEIWEEQTILTAGDGDLGDHFGYAVSFDGDNAVAGAFYGDYSEWDPNSGAAYIYSGFTSGHLSVSPDRLSFLKVPLGQSLSLAVDVKNSGFVDLNIDSIKVSGSGAIAFDADAATFMLAADSSKKLHVTFSPVSFSNYWAELEIYSDCGNKIIPLHGKGTSPLSVLPDSIDFGEVRVGSGGTIRNITLSNLGASSLTVDTVYISPVSPPSGGFYADIPSPFILEADSTRTLDIVFEPQNELAYTASFRIMSDVSDDSVFLRGSGYQAGIPQVSPDTIDFGSIAIGECGIETLYISNRGIFPLEVGPITLNGQGWGYFRADPYWLTLDTGATVRALVDFKPQTEGIFTVLLNTNTDGGNDTVVLTGSGYARGVIDVTPDTLHFGDIPAGRSKTKTLYVGNWGIADLEISSLIITGPYADYFYVDPSHFTIPPGGVRRLNVAFVPMNPGIYTVSLEIESDGGKLTVPMDAQCTACAPGYQTTVTANDTPFAAGFGKSVSISGFNAVIGGEDINNNSGAAYIFRCDGNGWTQESKLLPVSTGPYDKFGFSVDISEHTAVIGDPFHDGAGTAYIFDRQGLLGGWNLTDTLKPQSAYSSPFDNFGHTVAIDGDFVIVGAPETRLNYSPRVGTAYIFRGVGSPGSGGWHLLDSLKASDAVPNQRFGFSVDISDDYAIVGTLYSGAYIYQTANMVAGTRWYQRAKLISSDYQSGDMFGQRVAMDGHYAMVSAPMHPVISQRGAVYVFKRTGVNWSEVCKIISPAPSTYEQFGNTVALSGDFALIGTLNQQTVYLFRRMSDTNWTHLTTFYGDHINPSDGFGDCVGLDANASTGIIGVRSGFIGSSAFGKAHIYSALPVSSAEDLPSSLPATFSLGQNYPNPFNPVTTISFGLPRTVHTTLKIYDLLGRETATLINEKKNAGRYEVKFSAIALPSGVYFYRLTAGDFISAKKFLLLK